MCEGMGMSAIMISFHKTFSDYVEFTKKYTEEWANVLNSHNSLLVNLKDGQITKNFSFSCLTEDLKKNRQN